MTVKWHAGPSEIPNLNSTVALFACSLDLTRYSPTVAISPHARKISEPRPPIPAFPNLRHRSACAIERKAQEGRISCGASHPCGLVGLPSHPVRNEAMTQGGF